MQFCVGSAWHFVWFCWRYRCVAIIIFARCHHRRHYRCYSTLLSYRSIESESKAFTKRPHDMHNISQPLTIHFDSFYILCVRCTYIAVPILIKTIILLQFYCHPEKISGKHFVQAYMHSAHQSERKAGKKEQKKNVDCVISRF